MEVIDLNIVDPTQFDKDSKYFDPKSKPDNPRWDCVKVEYKSKSDKILSLSELKILFNEDELLVTEKSGTLYRVKNGVKRTVQGLPDIYVRGQGGLLDVALHPDYHENKIIYLTLGAALEGAPGGNTTLYCAKLNGLQLENPKLLYKAMPNTKKGQHWGSRIVFDQEGHVYFTVGDRGNRDVNPQDLTRAVSYTHLTLPTNREV